jgi:hypothetical protein
MLLALPVIIATFCYEDMVEYWDLLIIRGYRKRVQQEGGCLLSFKIRLID